MSNSQSSNKVKGCPFCAEEEPNIVCLKHQQHLPRIAWKFLAYLSLTINLIFLAMAVLAK